MNRKSLFSALRQPQLFAHRIYYDIYRKVLRNKGIQIDNMDWDNLLLIDACRYDLFAETCKLDGELSDVISQGSHTVEFLRNNFGKGTFYDTVYVSATPQLQWVGLDDVFHETVHVWKDGWNEELETVPPEIVCDQALKAGKQYPNKRLIVHFVQPHYPFIGDTGREIQETISARSGIDGEGPNMSTIWDYLESGAISEERVWKAYRENLEIVLAQIEMLLDSLVGKSVITSDHGNAFGESLLYGHPGKKAIEPLVKVPWLSVESESRRKIIEEEPGSGNHNYADDEELRERLSDLGYA